VPNFGVAGLEARSRNGVGSEIEEQYTSSADPTALFEVPVAPFAAPTALFEVPAAPFEVPATPFAVLAAGQEDSTVIGIGM